VPVPEAVRAEFDRIKQLSSRADGWLFGDYTANAFFCARRHVHRQPWPVRGAQRPRLCRAASRAPLLRRWRALGLAVDPVLSGYIATRRMPWPGPAPVAARAVHGAQSEEHRLPLLGQTRHPCSGDGGAPL